MSENPPSFDRIRVNDIEYELNRDNTSLYTYIGRAALYDHIYIETPNGAYQWRYDPLKGTESEQYNYLKQKVIENECPLHLNLKHQDDYDVEIYMQHAEPDWDDLRMFDE